MVLIKTAATAMIINKVQLYKPLNSFEFFNITYFFKVLTTVNEALINTTITEIK